jgi:CBS domain-containing protein
MPEVLLMMTVSRIIEAKGHDVVTARPDDNLADVARTLAQHRIGAVVVTDGGGAIRGMLSERDIVSAVAAHGARALDDRISFHMTTNVTSCALTALIDDMMAIMTAGKFRHVPVEENGRLVGIVSIGDVVKHRVAEIENEREALETYITS